MGVRLTTLQLRVLKGAIEDAASRVQMTHEERHAAENAHHKRMAALKARMRREVRNAFGLEDVLEHVEVQWYEKEYYPALKLDDGFKTKVRAIAAKIGFDERNQYFHGGGVRVVFSVLNLYIYVPEKYSEVFESLSEGLNKAILRESGLDELIDAIAQIKK